MFSTAVLTASAMREADRRTIEEFGIPGFTLMETAGRGVADAVEKYWGPAQGLDVTVCSGKGNNGGDGYVVARVLYVRGATVRVISLRTEPDDSSDAGRNYKLLQDLVAQDRSGRLSMEPFDEDNSPPPAWKSDLIVDAVLGTGITSAPRGAALGLIRWMNNQSLPLVAVDIASGVESDSGNVPGEAVMAALTVTMAARKAGLMMNAGMDRSGDVEVVEIGIPPRLLQEQATRPGCAELITSELVAAALPRRSADSNKFSAGTVLAIAGSAGLTGAAYLACSAAERTGAGYVICACPSGVQPILAQKFTTVLTLGLPETEAGTIAPSAMDLLLEKAARANALLIGCGLGRDPATQQFVRNLLREASTPVVIDADGLNALAGYIDSLADSSDGQWILTPHWGEFRRLTGNPDLDVRDRLVLASEYARRWNAVLVLKGIPSAVGLPDGRCYLGNAGNAALATAGTGDVLAGLSSGFRAQGLAAADAAIAGLQTGGIAADIFVERFHGAAMTAVDQLALLPDALTRIFERSEP